MSVLKEVVSQFKELTIVCPDCEWMFSDEQYTCTTCWCEGGHGNLNIYNYLERFERLIQQ